MTALGMIETNSIPAGVEAGDAMLKAADVALVSAQPVCAGKYIVLVSGDVAAVKASVAAGVALADWALVDSIVIPNVHEQVISAMCAATEISGAQALGILETFSLASAVICADTMVKAADVQLIEVRLGRGLGGKSFVVLTGEDGRNTVAAPRYIEGGIIKQRFRKEIFKWQRKHWAWLRRRVSWAPSRRRTRW
jgi:microcompartment protein CcmL/EutN